MTLHVYPVNQQGAGEFNGGEIVEQKPVGFPGEGSAVKRVGPLFYWAWAKANVTSNIPPHPHKSFEIISYVVKGEIEHGDSLGTTQRVADGGIQVMQTGSGVFHTETMFVDSEMFQIWFEPNAREALKLKPTYNQYSHDEFPLSETDGVRIKTVIGQGSPVSLVTRPKMYEVELRAGKPYSYALPKGQALAVVSLSGGGTVSTESESAEFASREFIVATAEQDNHVTIQASQENLRFVLIEVPSEVDYPLYRK